MELEMDEYAVDVVFFQTQVRSRLGLSWSREGAEAIIYNRIFASHFVCVYVRDKWFLNKDRGVHKCVNHYDIV